MVPEDLSLFFYKEEPYPTISIGKFRRSENFSRGFTQIRVSFKLLYHYT